MSFALFLLYVLLTFMRAIELYAPELAEFRPMLALWSVAFVAALLRATSRGEVAARGRHFALVAGVCLAMMASQLARGWAGGALKAFNDFLPSALLFVLVVLNVTTLQRLRITCAVVVIGLLGASLVGINAYFTGQDATRLVLRQNTGLHDQPDYEQAAFDRPSADTQVIPAADKSGWYLWRVRHLVIFSDPNDFAQAIVMALPMVWIGWAGRGWLARTALVLLPGAVLGYTILLTQSRGALVGIASMLFFGVRRLLGTTRTLMLLGLVLLAAVIGNLAGGRAFSTQERSAEERIEAWLVGIQLLKSYPVFGAGYGSFLDHNRLTAHNSYVLCFAEIGLLGYFLWLGLIVLTFKSVQGAVTHLPAESPARATLTQLRAALLGYLTCAWFLSRTYQPVLFFLLALCVAGWWIAQDEARRRGEEPAYAGAAEALATVPWARHTVFVLIFSILVVFGFVRLHTLGLG